MLYCHLATFVLALVTCASTSNDGLKKIKHIVLFMQENRALHHYFGTTPGIRGFQDPNAHVSKDTERVCFTSKPM